MSQRHIKKYLFISVALNVAAFGYITMSWLTPASAPITPETKTVSSSQIHDRDDTQHAINSNTAAVSNAAPSSLSKATVKSSNQDADSTLIDDSEKPSSSKQAMAKKLDLAVEILGENYRSQLTENNLTTVAAPLLADMATNPSYSDEEQLNALHGLENIADKKSYEKASLTLLNNAYAKNNTEHTAELLYELNDVDTHEMADSVALFLSNPDKEVRVAALAALGRDKNNTYAQSLFQKHAATNPQDILEYLKETQPAQN